MRNVLRITTEGKIRPVRRRAIESIPEVDDRASLVALIQAVIPLGLQAVGDVLHQEVTTLAGARDSRSGGQPGYVRWGRQRGRSICWIRNCRSSIRGCGIWLGNEKSP